MKFIIGQISHETNTFAVDKTTKHTFQLWEWKSGQEIIDSHRRVRDYLGGMIDRAEELNIEIIPTLSAMAYPSGLITQETYKELKEELIQRIINEEADAICLNLHGAGVVEGIEDMEGDLLCEVRKVVGYSIPIICTLDLHANLTETMVKEADALLGVNFYPHIDSYERGNEAIDIAVKIVKKEIKPVMSMKKLPLIIPTSTSNLSPVKDINQICWNWEAQPVVIDCTFFHGFPYTDTSINGVSVLTITNNNCDLANQITKDVSQKVWEMREHFFLDIPSPREGIEQALAFNGYPVVINETSDNPGGGTPGDGTYLLEAMLSMNLEKACFGYVFDQEVALAAHKAGVGSFIEVELGGKTDSLHGKPLQIIAYVKSVTDGQFTQSSPMWGGLQVNLGKSARLQVNGVDIIVCSVKSQVLDEQIFLLHGIDVSTYKIVALKSSQHFRAAFEPISKKIITVDSPGLTTMDFTSFKYKNIQRPVYPIDEVKNAAAGLPTA
ncbi:M81 family metallopeptidase [Fredinandcohnia onubensis]|uniref:M81 family metallopeptidase n=1 Tax=Fredinandcohnia onubensis TaxID=1571209 RepID=UPI000C0C07DE|nr:M81 family metallopeptidase [Fredinandcohnia onubensis]